jgi:Domain of unknown function (DUF4832)/Domain of unknown function (DUF4874)
MNLIRSFIYLGFLLTFVACSQRDQTSSLEPQVITTYQASSETFPNPERGYPDTVDPDWPQDANGNYIAFDDLPWDFCGVGNNFTAYNYAKWTPTLNLSELQADRQKGISLVMIRYHIAAFRTKDLSQAFLERLTADFATARQAGMKVVFRFAYNYPKGGPDASLTIVLNHLEQLRPILTANVDVIAFMDLGFIGCWGEMHTSSNTLVEPNSRHLNEATRQIIDKAFEVLPKERMIAVRYPAFKFEYFGGASGYEHVPTQPLTAAESFRGSVKARWGQHDDCIVCGEWNVGTWWSYQNNAAGVRAFLSKDNLYVVQSGETGNPNTLDATTDEDGDGYTLGEHDSCQRVLGIFKQMRFSTLNAEFDTSVTERWQREGCYDTIAKNLGYRFQLVSSSIPASVSKTKNLVMSFDVKNVGYASPYNPRRLELILRNKTTKQVFKLILNNGGLLPGNSSYDPRFWQPNTTTRVAINKSLPSSLPTGTYDVLLNLSDPKSTLSKRPEYSIRLANQNVWEVATGYNALLRSIVINP